MKKKFLKFPISVAMMVATILMFSCSQYEEPEHQQQSFSGEEYFKGIYFLDGEVADKISIFSTMKQKYVLDNDADVQQEIQKVSGEMMDIIRKEDAGFFNGFKAAMESKDQTRIEQALRDGSQLIKKSTVKLFQNNEEYRKALEIGEQLDIKKAIGPDGLVDEKKLEALYEEFIAKTNAAGSRKDCLTINIWVNFNIHFNVNINANFNLNINANAAININIWRNVNFWDCIQIPKHGQADAHYSETPSLQKEMVIQQIVEAF
jgi:hypothetical protein